MRSSQSWPRSLVPSSLRACPLLPFASCMHNWFLVAGTPLANRWLTKNSSTAQRLLLWSCASQVVTHDSFPPYSWPMQLQLHRIGRPCFGSCTCGLPSSPSTCSKIWSGPWTPDVPRWKCILRPPDTEVEQAFDRQHHDMEQCNPRGKFSTTGCESYLAHSTWNFLIDIISLQKLDEDSRAWKEEKNCSVSLWHFWMNSQREGSSISNASSLCGLEHGFRKKLLEVQAPPKVRGGA
jgi:hypothetical protein